MQPSDFYRRAAQQAATTIAEVEEELGADVLEPAELDQRVRVFAKHQHGCMTEADLTVFATEFSIVYFTRRRTRTGGEWN